MGQINRQINKIYKIYTYFCLLLSCLLISCTMPEKLGEDSHPHGLHQASEVQRDCGHESCAQHKAKEHKKCCGHKKSCAEHHKKIHGPHCKCQKKVGCKKACHKTLRKSKHRCSHGCQHYHRYNVSELKRELVLWKQPSSPMESALTAVFPLEKKVELALVAPSSTKLFSLESYKKHKKHKRHHRGCHKREKCHKHKHKHKHEKADFSQSGLSVGQVSLTVPESGIYRVSLGERTWVGVTEVTSKGNALNPHIHRVGKVSGSEEIKKVVEFTLEAQKPYVLEFYKYKISDRDRESSKTLSIVVSKVEGAAFNQKDQATDSPSEASSEKASEK